jgi:pteridine reductase
MNPANAAGKNPHDGGPVALVTGAGKRIGAAVAQYLFEHGYRLALHANHSLQDAERAADKMTAAGGQAIALQAELRDEDAARMLARKTLARFGRIDALVNCAAIWKPRPLEKVTAADVREHFEVNALATFLCCQHVGLAMAAQQGGGAIVNVGDWAVARPYVNYAAYFPSKGAIPTLTRNFAVELAQRNPRVRVNAVLPGPVLLSPDLSAAERSAAVAGTLVKREGTVNHVAHAVLFLLENDFITGVSLPVDGGRSIFDGVFEHQ